MGDGLRCKQLAALQRHCPPVQQPARADLPLKRQLASDIPTTPMNTILTDTQRHVDAQIEARIFRLSHAAWKEANTLPSGRLRKTPATFSHPQEVHDLLAIRQRLYAGEDPETISAEVVGGDIQAAFLKAS